MKLNLNKNFEHFCPFDSETEKWFKQFKKKSIKIPCGWVSDISTKPKWYDHLRFKKGEKLCNENLFALFFSHLCGLYLLVYIPSILYPLLSTGKSKSTTCIFLRYRDTLIHVSKWYEGNIWDSTTEGYNSLNQVRKMHQAVADRLNLNKIEGKVNFLLSQYDMALTQFAFCGLIILYPNHFGFFPKSDEDLICILHFWRCTGYLLGIKDEYNICDESNLTLVKSRLFFILEKEIKPALVHAWRQESELMADAIIESIRTFIPILTVNGFKKYLFNILFIKSEKVEESKDWATLFNYHLMNFHFKYGLSFPLIPRIFNKLLKMAINKTSVHEEKICSFLSVKNATFKAIPEIDFDKICQC